MLSERLEVRLDEETSGSILAVEDADARRARHAETHPALDARDALHLAVMERHGLTTIVSADRSFDGIPGFTRLDPADFPAPA